MKYFIVCILMSAFYTSCSSDLAEKKITDEKSKMTHQYTLVPVEKTDLLSKFKLPAQFAAYQEVSIFPKVNGYVKEVYVDIGSKVKKGELLMTLEAPELEQSTMQARENWIRTKADLAIDREHYNRLLEASQTPGAISPLDLSFVKAKLESDSALSNAAKSNWQMRETMQQYLIVRAPFSGVITERNVHPGALVSAESKDAKPMLQLKEIDHLRLQFDIPEDLAGSMQVKDTISFYTSVSPGKKLTGHISRKSMNVNAEFRSERVEADVNNPDETLAPGMYADIVIYPKGNVSGFFVPKSCVVTSTERKYILAVRAGKITKIDVTTGIESGNSVEVFGNLLKTDSLIKEATDEIKEGNY